MLHGEGMYMYNNTNDQYSSIIYYTKHFNRKPRYNVLPRFSAVPTDYIKQSQGIK